MVEPVIVDDPLELACEPLGIVVLEDIGSDSFPGASKPDPSLGNDAELALATPHRVEQVGVQRPRAPYPFAGSGYHLELLDVSDLRPVPVGGDSKSSGGQRSTDRQIRHVRQYMWQSPYPAQRVDYRAPSRSGLGAEQIRLQKLEPIEPGRVDHKAPVREALTAL